MTPQWRFDAPEPGGMTFNTKQVITCSQRLAKCLQAIRDDYLGGGDVQHLGIGVARKFPRRANGHTIVRYIHGRRVLTGHYNRLKNGAEAIDITTWGTHDHRAVYDIAREVAIDHPEWYMSVVLYGHWVHVEVGYPHLEGIDT